MSAKIPKTHLSSTSATSRYRGHNGFSRLAQTIEQKQELHEHALNVLEFQSSKLPSRQTLMEKDWSSLTRPKETVESMKDKIENAKKERAEVLMKIYDLAASDYCLDVRNHNMSFNELLDMEPQTRKDHVNETASGGSDMVVDIILTDEEMRILNQEKSEQRRLDSKLLRYPFVSPSAPTPAHLPAISRLMHSYSRRLTSLRQQLKILEEAALQHEYNMKRREEEREKKKKEEREAKERRFPQTVEEFRAKNPDFQRAIARFLVGGDLPQKNASGLTGAQEKILREWKWLRDDVYPLIEEYKSNPMFNADIKRTAIMLEAQSSSRDPRKSST